MEDNWYLTHKPFEIIAQVATTTLAVISKFNPQELIRIGWLVVDKNGKIGVNPVIDILYSMTSAGVWIARTDASGLVEEANSLDIYTRTVYIETRKSNEPTIARLEDFGADTRFQTFELLKFFGMPFAK